MQRHDDGPVADVDEYLWPLTGEPSPVDWEALAEELRIRERLTHIAAHVREMHVQPRLRRLGARAAANAISNATQAVIVGPEEGPVWTQQLKDPVPRALREEWSQLTRRLHEIHSHRPAAQQPSGR